MLEFVAVAAVVGGLIAIAFSRFPKAYSLGLLIMAVFGFQALGDGRTAEVTRTLALVTSDLLEGRQVWTPLTYMFVHADLMHLFGNLFILLTVGPILEERVGSRRFLAIFLVAGLAAALAHMVLTYTGVVSTVFTPAVGASGAIFGVLTAFAVRYPRESIPIPLLFIVWMPAFAVLLVYLAMNVGFMFRSGSIAWWGHFAGFLVGLAWATRLEKRAPVLGPGGTRAAQLRVDVEVLRPLATNRRLEEVLARLEQFSVETATAHDREYQEAWLDRFFQGAQCPKCGGRLHRDGLAAACEKRDYRVEFALARDKSRFAS